MDLFSQLDRIESASTGERIVVIRYRTRFHHDIIYSNLSTNPSMSKEDIATAVAINDQDKFLPQPWPPQSLDDTASISWVSLLKMKKIVNVGMRLPEVPSALLTALISDQFPGRESVPTTSDAITSCETRITHDGAVTSSFGFPNISLFHADHFALRKYTKAMLILSMQQYLESLR